MRPQIVIERQAFAQRLAQVVLEWLSVSGWVTPASDLCLIRTVPGIDRDNLPSHTTVSGAKRWALAYVDSDLALRLALSRNRGAPLIAFSDRSEDAFQADLRERCVLRRVIQPLARHMLSAIVDRDASALDEERFRPAVIDVLEQSWGGLSAAVRRRTWGGAVRDQDAAAILCEAAFGFDDRQSGVSAADLWRNWIINPPVVTGSLSDLASDVLKRRYPAHAGLLSRALVAPRDLLANVARNDFDEDNPVTQVGIEVARCMLSGCPRLLEEILRPAETAYIRAGSPQKRSLLLESAFKVSFRSLVERCESHDPPKSSEVTELSAFVYAYADVGSLNLLARLSRGLVAAESQELPVTLQGYADAWRDNIAWLDRAARRLRSAHIVDAEARRVADNLVQRWYDLRDRWNADFATLLRKNYNSLFASPGESGPLIVSHLLKYVIRPALDEWKTFLVILDGCDVPSFLELADALSAAGVVPIEPLRLALSAIPTLTTHARRAIFGGEIPRDGLRDDDDRAADATGDRQAFERSNNAVVGNYSRKLFLKGDLGDGGAKLTAALKSAQWRLISAVFNDVDDALSSKERTVLPERTLANASRAFRDALITAADEGWRIVVTADHGNTPYREPDIVVSGLGGTRCKELPPDAIAPNDAMVFEKGVGLPYRIAALYQLGAHGGPQHVGYHGGVAMEEMFVPLAVLGSHAAMTYAPLPPGWWTGEEDVTRSQRGLTFTAPSLASPVNGRASDLARCTAAISVTDRDGKNAAVLEKIAEAGVLTPAQLASALALPVGRVRLRVTNIITKLREAGIEPPITIEDEPECFRWIGQ